ncbi:MAG: FHA domain-containing protein [Lachnospiraceae bacterium]|nr:FHA domain-containing protein [Lachnospiraceae bacterium]
MEVSFDYVRNHNKNYISVCIPQMSGVYHEICMLRHNELRTLLGVSLRFIDNSELLDYDVSGFSSLSSFFDRKKLDAADIRSIIKALCECVEETEMYLLSPDGIVLNPQYIYIEPTLETKVFIYNAGDREEFGRNLGELIRFIMDRVDFKDGEATTLAYALFALVDEDCVSVDKLREYISEGGETIPVSGPPAISEEKISEKPVRKRSFFDLLFGRKSMKTQLTEHSDSLVRDSLPAIEFDTQDKRFVTQDIEKDDENGLQFSLEELDVPEGGEAERFMMTTFPYVVGKQADIVDRCIEGPAISRRHAKFTSEGGRLYVEDLNSRNGTFLNNVQLTVEKRCPVSDGDVISLANRRFMVTAYPMR